MQRLDRVHWGEHLIILGILIGPILVEIRPFEVDDVCKKIKVGDENWPRFSDIAVYH